MRVGTPTGGPEAPLPSDRPSDASRLLSEKSYYTDEELIKAKRSSLVELEKTARELERQVLAAQFRLGALEVKARELSAQTDKEQVAGLVPWAKEESVAIVQDARRRAAELNQGTEHPPDLEDLGRMLLSHFELQEQLVRVVTEAALGVGPGDLP
jgi:hypothetical protein